ncbi:hypothetical protein MRQ36_15975 [Micromonospora sp. R77]|uniref:hypothetical protein n=1 Tax=Micromonospora sp. R77 TaxID=2925836 RepID=UPI001F61CB3D|nr:hypothetical protein [Micromonospora sp. R77]MCI4064010.1 hypothetical protein [Micromonospora sp. R77]
MILKARATDEDHICFLLTDSVGRQTEFVAARVPPSDVQRSTGTFRDPDLLVDLTPALVSALLDASEPEVGMVMTLIVHTVSRRAAAVGSFTDTAAARVWWHQPYNRLARDPDVLFLTVPVEADA